MGGIPTRVNLITSHRLRELPGIQINSLTQTRLEMTGLSNKVKIISIFPKSSKLFGGFREESTLSKKARGISPRAQNRRKKMRDIIINFGSFYWVPLIISAVGGLFIIAKKRKCSLHWSIFWVVGIFFPIINIFLAFVFMAVAIKTFFEEVDGPF